jgi:hypothetical protein
MVEIEEYNKLAFDEDEYLWKYLDMHKFLSFILKKELFFTRLDKFEDPIEGVTLHSLASKRFFQ